MGSDLAASRRVYPEDYARIESWFPLVGVSLAQYVFAKKQEVRHERRRDQISERWGAIHPAFPDQGGPYNPRIIGEGAEKRLRAFIKKHGLFGTIIWNERTGNIVSGHQRLKALDYNEKFRRPGIISSA